MKVNEYRNLIGIKFFNEEEFEKGTEVIFKLGYPFELIQNNIFLVSKKIAEELDRILKENGLVTAKVPVVSINELGLTSEERAQLRRESLKGSIPVPL